MSTVKDILKKSLWISGKVGQGKTPSAYLYAEALSSMNIMLDGWSSAPQHIYINTREDLALTIGKTNHSIGTGGDFNTVRPMKLFDSFIVENEITEPVKVILREQYDQITDKTTPGRPTRMYYEPSFPLGAIRFYPVPDLAYDLTLVSLKPLGSYALNATISLPQGYERAIVYNLAVEMGPGFGRVLRADVLGIATSSLDTIESVNLTNQMIPLQGLTPTRGDGILGTRELFGS